MAINTLLSGAGVTAYSPLLERDAGQTPPIPPGWGSSPKRTLTIVFTLRKTWSFILSCSFKLCRLIIKSLKSLLAHSHVTLALPKVFP